MPSPSSKLARILQAVLLAWLAAGAAWLAWSWPRSPWLSLAGCALLAGSYSAGLAMEFVMLRRINRDQSIPVPGWRVLMRAWLVASLHALRVFGWRQPFRWNEVPDLLAPESELTGRRGVVFVHGFFCNRGFWTPWLRRMEAANHPFVAVNLEPVFGSIDDYAATIDHAVRTVTKVSGLPPLLVGHSMGGLAARAWLRSGENAALVHHVVTIGSPHGGTWLGRFSRFPSGRQMALGSDWLRQLTHDSARPPQPGLTCWFSDCDNVVFPSSSATLPSAQNWLVTGAAHLQLAFHPQVMDGTLALLEP